MHHIILVHIVPLQLWVVASECLITCKLCSTSMMIHFFFCLWCCDETLIHYGVTNVGPVCG